jgi:molecular chaperone GrpE
MTKKDQDSTTTDDVNKVTQTIAALEAALLEAKTHVEQAKEAQLRALADLQNVQRREAENKQFWSQMAVSDFLRKFLPSLLELSLASAHTDDKDVKSVIEKFNTKIDDLGITKIEPVNGDPIDTDHHEVLMAAEGTPGTIVQTLELGWKYQDQVLLPAKVSAASL